MRLIEREGGGRGKNRDGVLGEDLGAGTRFRVRTVERRLGYS
jgi:hypothetical protein